jgi:hypothetical protein
MQFKARKVFKWVGLTFGGILLAALLLFSLAFADALGFFRRPPLRLEQSGSFIIVHVETLGEYPTTVGHVQITEAALGNVVFEVVARKEFAGKMETQIHNFRLTAGENSTRAVEPEINPYTVVVPSGKNTFTLQPGVKYRLTLWGDSWTFSEASFKF